MIGKHISIHKPISIIGNKNYKNKKEYTKTMIKNTQPYSYNNTVLSRRQIHDRDNKC